MISAEGNVTSNIAGFDQAMIYEPGTMLDDIDVPLFPPESIHQRGRRALDSSPPPPAATRAADTGLDTFDEPGQVRSSSRNVTRTSRSAKMYAG